MGELLMKCSVCGRKLRSPKSKEVGYGPVCYRKIMPPAPRKTRAAPKNSGSYNLMNDADYIIPWQMELSEFIDISEQNGGNECD